MQTLTENVNTVKQGKGCLIKVSMETAEAIFRIIQIEKEVNGEQYSVDELITEVLQEKQLETEDALQYHDEMGLTESEKLSVLAFKNTVEAEDIPTVTKICNFPNLRHLCAENFEVIIKEMTESELIVTVNTLFNGQKGKTIQQYFLPKKEYHAAIKVFSEIAPSKWDEISFNL